MIDDMHYQLLFAIGSTPDAPVAMRLLKVAEVLDDDKENRHLSALLREAADTMMRDAYTPPAGWRLVADTARAQTAQSGPAHYLSGPMTGITNNNYPAFRSAADALRERGVNVVSPAELSSGVAGWKECMRTDIRALCDCDALILMPGWETSKGAHLELHIAHRIGLRILHLRDLLPADPQPYDQGERAYVANVAQDAGIPLGGEA